VKAIRYQRYGPPDVLGLDEVDVPAPAGGEVLIRVRAASANPRDWHVMRGMPQVMRLQFGLRAPRDQRLGTDLAGIVEAVGAGVTRWHPGDEVYADIPSGAFAEHVCAPGDLVAAKPANLTFEEAAAVPLAAVTALQGLRDRGRVEAGQRVLIIGASGGVGTFAVQLAKHLGAHVTGVCSGGNAELVRSLGADEVVDRTRDDVTRSGRTWDLVFQVAGAASPVALRRVLTRRGMLMVGSGESEGRWIGPIDRNLQAVAVSPFVSQRLVPFIARRSTPDLELLAGLIEAGTVRPVIDRTYPLHEVPDAIRYLEEGHARGKVVISVAPS
jgi:NADPH:quinone reductase-like Zn-dependent oxidoreductase